MSLLKSMDIVGSGMHAQRVRLNLISSNLANANTTRTKDGGPYRRMDPVISAVSVGDASNEFEAALKRVQVDSIKEDTTPFVDVYDPGHPDADPNTGVVAMPNVNVMEEMVNMVTATRSYKANVTAFEALKQMAMKAMEIGR